MEDWRALSRQLADQQGIGLFAQSARPVAGGDIHHAYRANSDAGPLFIKTNTVDQLENFQAEATGLATLAAADKLRVPRPLACGVVGRSAYLVLEWLDLMPPAPGAGRRLGQGLAAVHRTTAEQFGFGQDNFIGRTPQPNAGMGNWLEFFRERRLRFQLELAISHGFGFLAADGRCLVSALDALFANYNPSASLLHGDLWAGNWGCLAGGEPVIFDPAVYFGDRETDLAMTRLFGGFSTEFYQAYEAAWPLSEGWQTRSDLYQLYHVLNHANLFGVGYARDAHARIKRLLALLS